VKAMSETKRLHMYTFLTVLCLGTKFAEFPLKMESGGTGQTGRGIILSVLSLQSNLSPF
jgi:hypothetical protein